ncbi:MAG: DAK2 domain-containing protein [Kouleothrix sp.]|jgi:dihydroxyacetone kinase|nr:DAK2 domain-containing protein [Kouleothrix sp.]
MTSANSLVALFEAMTQNIEYDRTQINSIDRSDGDAGDNLAGNFRLITDTLAAALGQAGADADIGQALGQAAQVLQQNGQGASAPIYAQGLADAAQRLAGKTNFTLDDLMPLLEGLLSGSRKASGMQQGDGSLLDVLLPGIMAYLQAKRSGQSDIQSILTALLNLRRGSFGTAQSPRGYGSASGSDTSGQIDPGAAGAASLLEGLFGALLRQALSQGGGSGGLGGLAQQQPAPAPEPLPTDGTPLPLPGIPSGIGDLLGTLFGGAGQAAPKRSTRRKYS